MKKAQGISINTIIIAAIALIVLVVLIAVFTGRIGIWGQQVDDTTQISCTSVGGEAVDSDDCSLLRKIPGKYNDVGEDKVCCKTEPSGEDDT